MDPDLIDQAIAATQGDPLPSAEFRIFSGILKTGRGDDGRRRLWGVASSTVKDLHGDTMLESALDDMLTAANSNLTIFLNHSYNVTEDVAGSVESAHMSTKGVDDKGEPIRLLNFQIVINEKNPRAVEAWESMDGGTKLGLSIGAMIPEGGATRDRKSGSLTIAHVNLLETSVVSIPANPLSWVERATKALRRAETEKRQTMNLGSPTLTLDGDTYTIQGSMDGIALASIHPGTGVVMEGIEVPADGVMREFTITKTVEVEIVDASCPDCGKDKASGGDCGNPFHKKDVEPDIADAKIRIIEVDTDDAESSGGNSSQEAGSSDPGTGEDTAVVETVSRSVENLEPYLAASVRGVLALLESTTTRLVETQALLDVERSARQLAETQRSETIEQTAQIMVRVASIVEQLGNTPLARKASFINATKDLSHLESIYGPEFLQMLPSRRGG